MTARDVALVREAIRWLADAVQDAPPEAWDRTAGDLDWTCRFTLDHLLDDLLAYALQLTAARDGAALDDYLPVVPSGGGDELVSVDPDAGSPGAAASLRAFGELFVAALETSPHDLRAFHPWGRTKPGGPAATDAAGYAAVALLETLVHGQDILTGLGLPAAPPTEPSAVVVARLFPDAPEGPPADVLLWCTGRTALVRPDGDELPRRAQWRPDTSVRG